MVNVSLYVKPERLILLAHGNNTSHNPKGVTLSLDQGTTFMSPLWGLFRNLVSIILTPFGVLVLKSIISLQSSVRRGSGKLLPVRADHHGSFC